MRNYYQLIIHVFFNFQNMKQQLLILTHKSSNIRQMQRYPILWQIYTQKLIIYLLTDMLKSCYFTPRHEIINWINQTLHTQITKIEQLGAGNIYCHLLDAAYPKKVPMHKVKWVALLQTDFIYNFKILQNCFEHLGISKEIDVQKLVKAKYQDNLEFSQWLKGQLCQKILLNKTYDAISRRNSTEINLNLGHQLTHTKSTAQLNINYSSNKENTAQFNQISTPRASIKSARRSLGQMCPKTPISVTKIDNSPVKNNKKVYIKVGLEDKKQQLRKPVMLKPKRVHTQMGPLIIHDITKELIFEDDEEQCF